jgi:hypothetical protein
VKGLALLYWATYNALRLRRITAEPETTLREPPSSTSWEKFPREILREIPQRSSPELTKIIDTVIRFWTRLLRLGCYRPSWAISRPKGLPGTGYITVPSDFRLSQTCREQASAGISRLTSIMMAAEHSREHGRLEAHFIKISVLSR